MRIERDDRVTALSSTARPWKRRSCFPEGDRFQVDSVQARGDRESKGRPTYGVNVPVASNRKSSCIILNLPTGIPVDFRENRNNYIYLPALLPTLPISCRPLSSSNVRSCVHMSYFPEFSHCSWRVRPMNLCSSSRVSQIRIVVQIPA